MQRWMSLLWRLAVDPVSPGGVYDFWIPKIFLPARTPKSHNLIFSLSISSSFHANSPACRPMCNPRSFPTIFPSNYTNQFVSQYQSPNFPTLTLAFPWSESTQNPKIIKIEPSEAVPPLKHKTHQKMMSRLAGLHHPLSGLWKYSRNVKRHNK